MATASTIRHEDESAAAVWELYAPAETDEQRQKREALRQELLAEARESVKRVEEGQRRTWTREETLALFERLRSQFESRNPGVDPVASFLADRRAEAERD